MCVLNAAARTRNRVRKIHAAGKENEHAELVRAPRLRQRPWRELGERRLCPGPGEIKRNNSQVKNSRSAQAEMHTIKSLP